jgi:hypothetical protein
MQEVSQKEVKKLPHNDIDRDNHRRNIVERKWHGTKYEKFYSMGELVQQIGDKKLSDDVVMVIIDKNHRRRRHNNKSMQRKRSMAYCDACGRELPAGQIILYSMRELVSHQDNIRN